MNIKLDDFWIAIFLSTIFVWIALLFLILFLRSVWKKERKFIFAWISFFFIGLQWLSSSNSLNFSIERYMRIHKSNWYQTYEVRTMTKTGEKYVVLDLLKVAGNYYSLITPVEKETNNELIFDTSHLELKNYRGEDYTHSFKSYKMVKNKENK